MSLDYVLLVWEVVCMCVCGGNRDRNGKASGQLLGVLASVLLSPLNKNKQAPGGVTATGNPASST